jgi:hypothetical protein
MVFKCLNFPVENNAKTIIDDDDDDNGDDDVVINALIFNMDIASCCNNIYSYNDYFVDFQYTLTYLHTCLGPILQKISIMIGYYSSILFTRLHEIE